MRAYKLLASAATLALGLVAVQPAAHAAVIQVLSGRLLAGSPVTVSLGSGTFTFSQDLSLSTPAVDVATSGSGQVSTIFGGIADFEAGATINNDPANLVFSFAASPSASLIPNSQADDFVGLSYTDPTGTHYGFAEVFGTEFVGYAVETTANTPITTAAVVPEPASVVLLIGGLAMVGLVRRKAA